MSPPNPSVCIYQVLGLQAGNHVGFYTGVEDQIPVLVPAWQILYQAHYYPSPRDGDYLRSGSFKSIISGIQMSPSPTIFSLLFKIFELQSPLRGCPSCTNNAYCCLRAKHRGDFISTPQRVYFAVYRSHFLPPVFS